MEPINTPPGRTARVPSVHERLTKAHEQTVKQPRPYQLDVTLTAEEAEELAGLSPNERRTRFREIQAERGTVK